MRLNFKSGISVGKTTNPLFTLGIDTLQEELSHMPAGGVWWLNVDIKSDAVNLINQMVISQISSAKVAVIAPPAILRDEIKFHKKAGPEFIHLFSMPDSGERLGILSRDLMCSINPSETLFIVLFPENAFDKTDEQALKSDLLSLSAWATEQQCSLVLINTGNFISKQYSLLLNAHQSISGLARLMSNHHYDVAFWCNERGVSAGQRLALQYHENGWQVIYDTHSTPQHYGDENIIISHIDVMEGTPELSENWQIHENNEKVFESASLANAATIIFYFSKQNQIIELSRQIHTLRIHRGNALKIIVREKHGQLRAADVQLLLNCGATLVIPQEVSLPRSLNMVSSVQGTLFSQTISSDLDSIIRQMKPQELKGYQSKEVFSSTINELIQDSPLATDHKGLLVALRPLAGLRPNQALTVCRIKRMGDIITLGEDCLMLFLANCHLNDMHSVLQRLFPLKLGDIFSHCLVWYTDEQITSQLYRFKIKQPIVWQNGVSLMPELTADTASLADTLPITETATVHSPVPFTLLDDIQVKKPS
ncbi:cellulose biosynthesis protein BcsE [Klebsiella sp. BIGb0407]|uniref:cellulose biosynthesis protein BcsE n=1 Tax=Klebsiella sp. BIGb0407 TaxID=2940603 RepID=UPI002169E8C5|nr:cellulose biosynthesis protein BcsE [Klebsiella sp. BIGb0407]MCS3431274.1 cellulose biosynthesis protein BcsE [Klebsiella sp. BIGb0407]